MGSKSYDKDRKFGVHVTLNVDVIVCAKNRAKSLNRVLQQIVREIPFKDLIVIYASSEDNTREIAEKYTNQVFWDGDKGLGAARNLGVRKATSEIVAMIDTDIVLTKGWYQQLIGHFKNSKVAAVMGTCIYGYGSPPLEALWEYKRWTDREDCGCHNTMFRRDVVLEVGNFDETIRGAGEDRDLYRRLLDAGYKWVWVREVAVYHPMNMREYLDHVRWWAQGHHWFLEVNSEVTTKYLFRICCRSFLFILVEFLKGMKLSVRVHPMLVIYYPLTRIIHLKTMLNELKKKMLAYRGLHP